MLNEEGIKYRNKAIKILIIKKKLFPNFKSDLVRFNIFSTLSALRLYIFFRLCFLAWDVVDKTDISHLKKYGNRMIFSRGFFKIFINFPNSSKCFINLLILIIVRFIKYI